MSPSDEKLPESMAECGQYDMKRRSSSQPESSRDQTEVPCAKNKTEKDRVSVPTSRSWDWRACVSIAASFVSLGLGTFMWAALEYGEGTEEVVSRN